MSEYWGVMVPELSVMDYAKSLHFYTQILGFNMRIQREAPSFAYLEREKVQIMLEQFHDEGWNSAEHVYPLGRGVNFQMEFSEIDSMHTSLGAIIYPLYQQMQDSWYDTGEVLTGQKEFLVQDPDGCLLRFTHFIGEKPKC
jgi:hypothetical protein